MINNRQAKTDARCMLRLVQQEADDSACEIQVGFRVRHEIHSKGLVMAMIADCWTCADA